MRGEKEKMLAGEWFDPHDAELTADRDRATRLMHRLNVECCGHGDDYRTTLGELCPNVRGFIREPFHCDYGYNIHVGEGFYANYDCIMLDSAPITIGDGCMFGPRVSLITATHPVEAERRCWRDDIPYEGEYARPITIGDQVWLGAGVIVNPGVTIGDRAVIASGSVVTRDIPADSLAAGVPAVVKKRLNSV